MISSYLAKSAIRGLLANKMRSFLTILGIIIGVAAIILVTSLGNGAQNLILSQIQGIGAKVIAIAPGRQPKGPTDFASIFSDSLKQRDLELLQNKANLPNAKVIMPVVFGSESVSFEGETYRSTIFGLTDYFTEVYKIEIDRGRVFSPEEIESYADVVVIGSKVQNELFVGEDPIGQKIRIKNNSYRIVGALANKGQVSFINFDDTVIMPYTTAQRDVFGIKHYHRIAVEADQEANVERTVADIKEILRSSHGITDPSKDDFFIETQAEAMAMVSSITGVLTAFLVSIAAISLVVGGVGIMNIMLVSVTERTREIGLRKALGATEKNILWQFIFEAMILTLAGGFFGVLIGALFSFLASLILSQFVSQSWSFVFPLNSALIGILVSTLVGLVFGIYPARQAAKKNPIEALRYE